MSADSGIEWTHHTFNPWWGCTKVSAGCASCYAESSSKRYGFKIWGQDSDRRFFGDKHWAEPLKWDRAAEKAGERHRVFCASMADVFEARGDLEESRERLFALIDETPHLDWLLLTKRPENMVRMWPWSSTPANVWAGATGEDQENLAERWRWLSQVDARVRFLSCEPLLGPLDFTSFATLPDWVILGGESGARPRLLHTEWIASALEQLEGKGVARFVKQLGQHWTDGSVTHKSASKWGDPNEWLAGLRVRQFPASA